jgi:hypothetical protein
MKNKIILFPIIAMLLALLSCDIGGVEFDPGIELTTCSSKCGEIDTCQTSRGDMNENQKVDLNFRVFGVNQDGTRDFPENVTTINITAVLTVDGEGSARITLKDANGESISAIASNGSAAEITADVTLFLEQEKPTELSDQIQSANIQGISVEAIDGPATGVQLNLTVNGCVSYWCTETHPVCAPR